MNKPYKKSELKKETEIKTNALKGQKKQRAKWKKQIVAGKNMKLKKVPLKKYKKSTQINMTF